MLPDLSALPASPSSTRVDGAQKRAPVNIGLPAQGNIPNIPFKDAFGGPILEFAPKVAFALFKAGAVFSCVDDTVRVDSSKDSVVSTAMQQFESMPEDALSGPGIMSGAYNRSEVVSLDSLGANPNVSKYKLFAAAVESLRRSPANATKSIDKLVVRSSKSASAWPLALNALNTQGGDINSLLDYLFQEMYLTMFAASIGVGPLVYACKLVFIKDANHFSFALIPRVVYLLEAGDANLTRACLNVAQGVHAFNPDAAIALSRLFSKTSEHPLLLLDLKPSNIIAFLDGHKSDPLNQRAYARFKLIDFAPDFATIVNTNGLRVGRKLKLQAACQYMNVTMLALIVGTAHRNDTNCMLPLMEKLYVFLNSFQTRMDNPATTDDQKGPLAVAVQTKMYTRNSGLSIYNPACPALANTILDDNGSIDRIVQAFMNQISYYVLANDTDMTLPENANVPRLFRETPFDPSRPIIPQLVRNFLAFYKPFYEQLHPPAAAPAAAAPAAAAPAAEDPRRSRQGDAQGGAQARSRSREN